MSKECINVFAEMYKAKNYTWSDLVKKGNIITISGTVATDENHRTLFKGDVVAQTRYIYETVGKLLERAGASFDDVINVNLKGAFFCGENPENVYCVLDLSVT